jgi:hypothetical protein
LVIQPLLVSNSIHFTPTFTPSAQICVLQFELLVKSERLILILAQSDLPLIGRESVDFEIVPVCGTALAYHFKAIPQVRWKKRFATEQRRML